MSFFLAYDSLGEPLGSPINPLEFINGSAALAPTRIFKLYLCDEFGSEIIGPFEKLTIVLTVDGIQQLWRKHYDFLKMTVFEGSESDLKITVACRVCPCLRVIYDWRIFIVLTVPPIVKNVSYRFVYPGFVGSCFLGVVTTGYGERRGGHGEGARKSFAMDFLS